MNRSYQKDGAVASVLAAAVFMVCNVPALGQDLPSLPSGAGPNPKAVMMYNLGIKAYKQGSIDAAVIFFNRAVDVDPNLADAQYNLAVIYQSQKRYKEAIPHFEEVLRIKPNDPDAQFQLGVILQESGHYPESRQHLAAIAPNSGHFPEAQRRMAQLNSSTPQGAASAQAYPSPNSQNPSLADPRDMPAYQGTQPTPNTFQPSPYQPNQPNQSTPQVAPYSQPSTGYIAPSPSGNPPAVTAPDLPLNNPSTPAYQAGLQPTQPLQPNTPVGPSNPMPLIANTTLRVVATGFNAPSGLSFDHNGNLYVANYMSNSIDRIAPDGTRAQFSSGTNIRGPIGLISDDGGNVYVANYNSGTVARINPAGVCTIIANGFKKPYYLALDQQGNLYVSQQEDNSIVRITLPHADRAALKAP